MPISCNRNGFQVASNLFDISSSGSAISIAAMLLYLMFISALVGIALLFINNGSPWLDWAVYSTCLGSGLIAVSILQTSNNIALGLAKGGALDIGGYFIGGGLLISGIALIVASISKQ